MLDDLKTKYADLEELKNTLNSALYYIEREQDKLYQYYSGMLQDIIEEIDKDLDQLDIEMLPLEKAEQEALEREFDRDRIDRSYI